MSILTWLQKIFAGTVERPSPSDILKPEGITEHDGIIEIALTLPFLNIPFTKRPKITITGVLDSNSMDPLVDFGSQVILIAGVDEENQRILLDFIKPGDIAVYKIPDKYPTIHRVIAVGKDSLGRFFRFKGDNNPGADPYLIRDSMVEWLYLGVIC